MEFTYVGVRVNAGGGYVTAENMKGILERHWSRKKSYVMKCKQ